jgi:hypothetical protein
MQVENGDGGPTSSEQSALLNMHDFADFSLLFSLYAIP